MKTDIIIRNAENLNEFTQVAELHVKYINSGFLASLGVRVLTELYRFLARDTQSTLIVAMDNTTVGGFVSGTLDVEKMFPKFIRQNFWLGFIIFPKLFSFSRIKRMFETLFYPSKNKNNRLPAAELLSIAVHRKYQGKNISVDLYNALYKYFQNNHIPIFKIIVGSQLKGPLKFYNRVGAKKIKEIEVHSGEKSWILFHDVNNKSAEI